MATAVPDDAREHAVDHAPRGTETLTYTNPEAVLADDTLSAAQKSRFLNDWLQQLRREVKCAPGDDVEGEAELVARLRRWLAVLGDPAH